MSSCSRRRSTSKHRRIGSQTSFELLVTICGRGRVRAFGTNFAHGTSVLLSRNIRTTMCDHRRAHATHDIRNGILMRSDVHRLYDLGLVTVESDLTFRVSTSIERDYSNGKMYYVLDGKKIAIPARPEHRPDSEALDWHANSVFRP